jgi:UDP-2,4-diacetamido-2,4,6-trideoxy-beta-L-altropyranose hydrolase
MSAPRRVLFFADAGPRVGGGHVMRCLTLARELTQRGAECAFVESRAAAAILRRFGWPAQTPLAMIGVEDLGELLAYAGQFAGLFDADTVVFDHYQLRAAGERALRLDGRKIVVIDDLADRPHDCDLLVDPGYGRRREDYAALVGEACHVLAGPDYALLRPDFAAARPRALSRRAKHGPAGRALVTLGLTDVDGLTCRVVRTLAPLLGDVRLDVAVGSDAPSLPELEALAVSDRRIHLAIDKREMASLAADADLSVGAGGSSVWERATVGLPTATVILAPNQRAMIERMAEGGLTIALDAAAADFEARLARAWTELAGDPALRWRLAERAADLCDGQGAARVARAVLDL